MRGSLVGWATVAVLLAGCGIGSGGGDGGPITFPLDDPDAGVVVGSALQPAPSRGAWLREWLQKHEQLLVGKP